MIPVSRQKDCKCFGCGRDIILIQNGGAWMRKLDPQQINFWVKKNGEIVVAECMKYGKWNKTFGYREHVCPAPNAKRNSLGKL